MIGCLLMVSTLLLGMPLCAYAENDITPTRQDSLRGSNGAHRSWWNVTHYDLRVVLDTTRKSVSGKNDITATIIAPPTDSLQIDLQELLFLDSVVINDASLPFNKEGNVWWVKYPFSRLKNEASFRISLYYHGKPRKAKNAPWDGGFIWSNDSLGNHWTAVACQGLGASSWWPCKDYQGDEPDSGMNIQFYIPYDASLKADHFFPLVTNGTNQPVESADAVDGWQFPPYYPLMGSVSATVKNPINTYNVTFYYGNYTQWQDTLMGEKGVLPLTYCPLYYHEPIARERFRVVKDMLRCFEHWMGPYPFYEDGYKLVEAPYLGMEHQSAIAYGNQYRMGYRGNDRSNTGVGLLFDFIIIHESGHEWFGNNITASDIADNWIHEGFTTYTETLFAEWIAGKEKAYEYCRGEWKNIRNNRPVIGRYGVQDEGSSDKYDKGAAVVHMIRMIVNNDETFRQLLRSMNRQFYHSSVTSAMVEQYISTFTGYDFTALFQQYLRTTQIPILEYYIKNKKLHYRFTNIVDGFTLPIEARIGKHHKTIHPTSEWQSVAWKKGYGIDFSKDFLIQIK